MISQLLFGEVYEIIEKTSAWYKILTEYDQYKGWIDSKMFSPVSHDYYKRLEQGDYFVSGPITSTIIGPDNTKLTITAGSTLGNRPENGIIKIDSFIFRLIDETFEPANSHSFGLINTAKRFLNSPYLWGGRTPFGLDCSGFTQIVYKINGMRLPRDASQQATIGESVNTQPELGEGDLVFFCNEEDKVVHVGLALPPDKIIHCSGMVRIDSLDEKGIFNTQLNQYTHRLHSMRRI